MAVCACPPQTGVIKGGNHHAEKRILASGLSLCLLGGTVVPARAETPAAPASPETDSNRPYTLEPAAPGEAVLAAPKEAAMADSGTCGERGGDSLAWTLDADGVLTICGTGKMEDYYDSLCGP